MMGTQNQVERFRTIAKRLVDEHSAEVFTRSTISSGGRDDARDEVYYNHLDVLNKELSEKAEQFIGNYKKVDENIKSEIWETCKRYVNQFIRRNRPDAA